MIEKALSNLIVLVALFALTARSASAAVFTLEPATRIAAPGELFSVDLKVDTQGEAVTSADALLNFDSSILSVTSVTPGTFFPQNFEPVISASQVYIAGSVEKVTQNRTGTGLLSTINFKAIGSGVTPLSFECIPGKTFDSNINKDTTEPTDNLDIINCTQLVDGSYTISGNVTSTQPTPTPQNLPGAGTIEPTLIAVVTGVVLTIVGILVML